ncbi:glycine-rich RNA-binding protein 4, mitochondrial-like isoform X2 [Henckelia pumila]|uniref:glycine-rich RNA-binding protein 4, mitochondrial-like isoform X2 n=1 Tax=Henckelia pumila TaxID=405737 RepID=UPI003C6DEA55
MALFCSAYNPQILIPQIRKQSSIPVSFRSRSPFPTKLVFGISRSPNLRAENSTRLRSSIELDNDAPSSSIVFVKGLAQSTSEGGLKMVFSHFGEVSRVKVILDKQTKKSLGFAYVWFMNEEFAETAVEEMNGKFFEGKFIYVTIAKPGSCKPRAKASRYKF